MAKFDQGGGCPCGLYRDCLPNCEHYRGEIPQWDSSTNRFKENVMKEEHDFGFTFVDEEQFTKIEKVEDKERLMKLRAMILPLLFNLKKNPEKDIIQWPGKDRVKSVDAFLKKMDDLVDGK